MIKLYTAPTPNGHKISCLLEALQMDYEAILVNLSEGEQFKPVSYTHLTLPTKA